MKGTSRFEGQVRWLHKVRLYPTCSQLTRLHEILRATRELYNALLEQRREAYRRRGIRVSAKMQNAEITALRAEDAIFASVYREVQDAVLHRLDLAFAAFFRRLKRGEAPGYPRFKSSRRWSQLEFPHADRALVFDAAQTRVRLPGIGSVKLRKGREVPPTFGRAFIVGKNGRWYAVFECHREVAPLPTTGARVGIDRGVRVLAALSTGELIENERPGSQCRARVEGHQRALDAVTLKDSLGRPLNVRDPKRRAAGLRFARAKEHEANARRDWLHKVSRALVNRFDLIVLEDLRLSNITASAKGTVEEPGRNVKAKSGLNRSLLDAGLGMLGTLIREKAEWAARIVIGVDPRWSSQTCSLCGHVAKESRDESRFACVRCRFSIDADINAACVILARAESPPMRAPGHARGRQHDVS